MLEYMSGNKEPARVLPDNLHGKHIALRFSAGVGDVVMAVGGTAYLLKDSECQTHAFVIDRQIDFIRSMVGVHEVNNFQELSKPEIKKGYDCIIEYVSVLNHPRELKDKDYYSLISERVNRKVGPGKFIFDYSPRKVNGLKSIFLHAGATNPNRRWADKKWEELAYKLVNRGFRVVWLGSAGDYGFTDVKNGIHLSKIQRLSKVSPLLDIQAREMAKSCFYFIGNDSGFCHIAGILNIPGLVLFSVTHPRNVICRYQTLLGIENFEKLGLEPTRSLQVNDPISRKLMDSITVSQVLEKLELDIDI